MAGHCHLWSVDVLVQTDEELYPAIPIDCGIFNEDFNASQYTGVTLSIPRRVPTSMRVGLNVAPSGLATAMKLSI